MDMSVNDLLKQNPGQLLAWLEQLSNKDVVPDRFWWLMLAEGATTRAIRVKSGVSRETRLQWALVAITAYRYLANKVDPDQRHAYEYSAMLLRASMINKFGIVAGDPVLDLSSLETWFFDNLTKPIDQVVNMAENWKSLPIDELKQLRRLKHRLSIFKLLTDKGISPKSAELQDWIRIRDRLP